MAKLNGITLTPETGTGTKTLSISADAFQGRLDRSTKFTAANSSLGITSSNSLVVTQKGKSVYTLGNKTIQSDVTSTDISGGMNDEIVTILTTQSGSNPLLWDYLDSTVAARINNVDVTKSQLLAGYRVSGDPGATRSYNVIFYFTNLPESVSNVSYMGSVSGHGPLVLEKKGTGVVTNDIWFSSTQSGAKTTDNITVTLNSDGQVTQGSAYVRTDPSDLSWTITAGQNS